MLKKIEEVNNMNIDYLKIIVDTLNNKKANNVKALCVKNICSICDYIIIADTTNSTHVKSLVDDLQFVLKLNNIKIKNIEKDENYNWIVIDCIDLIINVFHKNTREFYNLEKIWIDATEVFNT